MAVFISYARKDFDVVSDLARDIERVRHHVWFDRELTGGQPWWDAILESIRTCDLFVFVLSPASLKSKACLSELEYATQLGRPLLPVMVQETPVQLAPRAVAEAQIVDYRQRTPDAAFNLANALAAAPPPRPLPSPLPAEPVIPLSYLSPLRDRVSADSLTYSQQIALFADLKTHLYDEDTRDIAMGLLRDLRHRPDVTEAVAKDLDALLANPPPLAGTDAASNAQPAGWYADSTGRHQLRYWDGARWTEHVSDRGRQSVDPVHATGPASNVAGPATTSSGPALAGAARSGTTLGPPATSGSPPMSGSPSMSGPSTSSLSSTSPPATPHTPMQPPGPTAPGWSPGPATASTQAVAKWDTGSFVALIIASTFCTGGLLGIILGAMNLKQPARRDQARILLIVGVIVLAISVVLFAAGIASNSSSTTG
jgi:hypothetical protein